MKQETLVQAIFKLPIKMRLALEDYEELGPICVWTTICHREDARSIMCQLKILICNQMKTHIS